MSTLVLSLVGNLLLAFLAAYFCQTARRYRMAFHQEKAKRVQIVAVAVLVLVLGLLVKRHATPCAK